MIAGASFRRLDRLDMASASVVFRAAFDERMPWLAGLHTPDEDRAFWRGPIFDACEIWGAEQGGKLLGVIAFRQNWVDQLYVQTEFQGQGIGSHLLDCAKAANEELSLWTFQCNVGARRFYETHGFVVQTETDGLDNEEGEPDVLYGWRR